MVPQVAAAARSVLDGEDLDGRLPSTQRDRPERRHAELARGALDGVPGCHDLPGLRHRALEARGRIDGIAEHRELATHRRSDVAGQRPAGVDRDPHAQWRPVGVPRVEVGESASHAQRGANGLGRVIVLGQGRAEHREDGIAHELVERALVVEQHLGHLVEELVQRRGDLVRLHSLGHGGESHQVHEHDGHLAHLGVERRRVGRRAQDAVDHARRVIALQPLASSRLLGDPLGEARVLDGHRGIVGERHEDREVVFGELPRARRVGIQHANHVVLVPERRAQERPDAQRLDAVGEVESPVHECVVGQHGHAVADHGIDHRPAQACVAQRSAVRAACDA